MDRCSALKILQLGSDASIAEVKHNYRKLAARYHPDHHAQNPAQVEQAGQKMQELNNAYGYLLETIALNDAPEHPAPERLRNKIITFPSFTAVILGFIAIVAGGLLFFTLNDRTEKDQKIIQNSLNQPASVEKTFFSAKTFNQLSHSAIKELQQGLTMLAYDIGGVDGFMGPKTMEGIQSYCADFAVFTPCRSAEAMQLSVTLHATVAKFQPEWKDIVQDPHFHTWLNSKGTTQELQTRTVRPHELVKIIDQFNFTIHAPSKQHLPATGLLWQERQPLQSRVMTLDAGQESKRNFFIKLVHSKTKQDVLYGFLRAGDRWNMPLPSGDYQLKIAVGNDWFGKQYLFGPHTKICLTELQYSAQTVSMGQLIHSGELAKEGSIFDFYMSQ